MIFYDFEVFKHDWLAVFIDRKTTKETVIVNDKEKLEAFYEANKKDIWVGFNNARYDQWILKGILAGFNPKEINDWIIVQGKQPWKFSRLLNRFYTVQYDVMTSLNRGLKVYEAYQGHSIIESSIRFDTDRKLTERELEQTIMYCRNDVIETANLFFLNLEDFHAHLELVRMTGEQPDMTLLSKTKVQLSAMILEAQKPIEDRGDEFDIDFPENLKIEKYREILDWYSDPKNKTYKIDHADKNPTKNELKMMIGGIPHQLGYGGIHGAIDGYHGTGYFLLADVTSLYPSLMIEYDLLSRNCSKAGIERYKEIYKERLELKKAGKKAEQLPLKLVLNSTYGAMKYKFSRLYDPRQANRVCVYGQLFLVDLIEKLEGTVEIIQSNTDGILMKLDRKEDFYKVDDICFEWEKRTRLSLEFKEYHKVFQKDVNNYLLVDHTGGYTGIGEVKRLSDLDNNLPIINRALVDYMVHGTPVEQTIRACDDLIMFQQVDKLSDKYEHFLHNGIELNERCVRSFASLDPMDTGFKKLHGSTGSVEKVSNSAERVFVENGNVVHTKVPDKLNKNHYIEMAQRRLEKFGV